MSETLSKGEFWAALIFGFVIASILWNILWLVTKESELMTYEEKLKLLNYKIKEKELLKKLEEL